MCIPRMNSIPLIYGFPDDDFITLSINLSLKSLIIGSDQNTNLLQGTFYGIHESFRGHNGALVLTSLTHDL